MALVRDGVVSLRAYLLGLSVLISPLLVIIFRDYRDGHTVYVFLAIVVHLLLIAAIVTLVMRHALQVAWRAALLGACFGIGILISLFAGSTWTVFGWYLCILSFFHYSEYLTTAITNPRSLSLDTFLMNHSTEYGIAALCSVLEFLVERWLFPELKLCCFGYLGLAVCLLGEVVRKVAMLTAGSNFNHIIQMQREEGHVLVTHGIYTVCRHPSYVGWFWWSIGTQVLLCNPICMVGYTVATWQFFDERIVEEERTLLNFFGEEYVHYQDKVPTGLPFIKGYRRAL